MHHSLVLFLPDTMDLIQASFHPHELYNLLKFKLGGGRHVIPKQDFSSLSPVAQKCYFYLQKTSRSFSAVIQALDGDLRHAVCIFYLVLRALDTVEDDMTIPNEEKVPLLQTFHEKLELNGWSYTKSNEKDKAVLEDFPVISEEYRGLAEGYRVVISDITKRMGHGMSEFIEKEVVTMADWDLYCHYVAGLVGIGLSRLFSASSLEDAIVGEDTELANSMGLFLQKTNVIRDYLEDSLEGREFWPREAWCKYGKKLTDFQNLSKLPQAVHCLNELINNALRHVPDVLVYMSRLKNQSVFNFCAIPQVMAAATLAKCYSNPQVFSGVVKIRRGEAVGLMMEATDMPSLRRIISNYSSQLEAKIPRDDPNFILTHQMCLVIQDLCPPVNDRLARLYYWGRLFNVLVIIMAILMYFMFT
ncbi:putative squalene synthase [Apostichopus japonicus]|uniref:Squalene synthase n=1 Tax=Stichopus japonicus TaxID=307972 RepID=A0A2G8JQF3_STIJA|nr:putative squalene synthase [Apostichopus japonicus]